MVTLIRRDVLLRRNRVSRTCTGWLRLMGPVIRGTGVGVPVRPKVEPGLSGSTPPKAVAKRLE